MHLAVALLVASLPQAPIRGMTVSCPMSGQIWGTSAMRAALVELRTLGVQSVAIHPYARIGTDGSIQYRDPFATDYLLRAVQITNEEKLSLFWKPHLAYWGNFSWRGAIHFGDDEVRWTRFFRHYTAWMLAHARFAQTAGVPLLAVGVELDATVHREGEWRAVIAAVRKVYRGNITFASNWDSYERVPFWDALDYIGVQAYFPLSTARPPPTAEIERRWDAHLSQLGKASRRWRRPVLFTEIGYNRSEDAAAKPWDPKLDNNPRTRALRRKLMEVALAKAKRATFIKGMYWWKWIPGQAPWDRDFAMKDDEAKQVLKAHWGGG